MRGGLTAILHGKEEAKRSGAFTRRAQLYGLRKTMRFRPTIVVPAAGKGRRFGGSLHKLMQPFENSTVLGTTLRRAVESQLPVVLVTTSAMLPLARTHLALRDIIVLSDEEAARGMGASIASGIAERSGAPGWLVLPGDMPLVQPSTLLAVAAALEQHPVVYAQHRGRRGHPVAFAAELYSELIHLNDDDGARRVLLRYPAHGEETQDGGVLMDVDTVSDLENLRKAAVQAAS